MTAPASVDVPPRTTIDYVNTLLETYAIGSEMCPIEAKDAIEVCQNVKVPMDEWPGYVFMACLFYPKTDGEGCDFNKTMATRLRRALSTVLESTTRNENPLSNAEADALQEKIYTTLYPGGKMDVSSASEEDEGDGDGSHDDGACIVEIYTSWNGKKMETVYSVDLGRGDMRYYSKYALKQAFPDDWKDMVSRYNTAREKAIPTTNKLKGASHGGRVAARGQGTDRMGNQRLAAADRVEMGGMERIDDLNDMVEVADVDEGRESDETSDDEYYRKREKPQQGSTMVDSTDGRKNFDGSRQLAHNRREGHGEGGLVTEIKHRAANPKHRMSEPVPRVLGLGGRHDVQLERLPHSGPVGKRQRLSLSTPRTGFGPFDRTPLTGDGDRGFLATRTDTATIAMEFMSRVLQNEDILKRELEDLAAQNKYLQGLLEDEELALNIADDELTSAKRERQERMQLEEVLRAREQELLSVKMNLRKLQSKNDSAIKDLENEKEEWKAAATEAQGQLDRQREQHAQEVKDMERTAVGKARLEALLSIRNATKEFEKREKEFSQQRDYWGKEAALKLNEIEVLRTAKADLEQQLKKSTETMKSLKSEKETAQRETAALKQEYTMLSKRMQEDVQRIREEAKTQAERAAKAILQADQQLNHAMALHDAWSKVPDGLVNVQHLLDYEDATGERTKAMNADAKQLFMRLRPSQWKHCQLIASRHNKSNSYTFTVKFTKPDAVPGAPGSTIVFDVELEELKKRDYCQRALSEYYLSKVKPASNKSKAKADKKQVSQEEEGRVKPGVQTPTHQPAEKETSSKGTTITRS